MADADSVADACRTLQGCNPLILLGHLTPGGNERQGYLLAKGLSASAMRPGVIVWSLTNDDLYRGLLAECGIPVAAAPQGGGALAKIRWLRSVTMQVRPAILHAYAFYLNAAAAWAARGLHGVAIGSMRGDYAAEGSSRIYYAVNRLWPRTIIANSARARDAALGDSSPFRPRRILFVPNGLDLSAYRPRRHVSSPRPRLMGVGNLYPGKRWDRLIRAAARLRQVEPALDFSLDIVGAGGESGKLAALIAELNLQDRVTLLGRRYDVSDLLSESDVFVLVSDSEGMPNAVMEAMASGLPVVATDVGDIPRLVQDGVHGYLVSRTDDTALVDKLRGLVIDHHLRASVGAEALKKARTELGLDRLVQNTLQAYRQAGWRG